MALWHAAREEAVAPVDQADSLGWLAVPVR